MASSPAYWKEVEGGWRRAAERRREVVEAWEKKEALEAHRRMQREERKTEGNESKSPAFREQVNRLDRCIEDIERIKPLITHLFGQRAAGNRAQDNKGDSHQRTASDVALSTGDMQGRNEPDPMPNISQTLLSPDHDSCKSKSTSCQVRSYVHVAQSA
jgi:hypothetical protein